MCVCGTQLFVPHGRCLGFGNIHVIFGWDTLSHSREKWEVGTLHPPHTHTEKQILGKRWAKMASSLCLQVLFPFFKSFLASFSAFLFLSSPLLGRIEQNRLLAVPSAWLEGRKQGGAQGTKATFCGRLSAAWRSQCLHWQDKHQDLCILIIIKNSCSEELGKSLSSISVY